MEKKFNHMLNKSYTVTEEDGSERVIWDSRSCAVAVFPYVKDNAGNWYVLANKRGIGCPDFNGYWNCPCGYLDWGEDSKQAAARELYEETGIEINSTQINVCRINTSPSCNHQNVTILHYVILPGTVTDYMPIVNTKHTEKNEVADIRFIRIEDVYMHKFAFNHEHYIPAFYKRFVNIPGWKRFIIKLINKI